VCPMIMLEVMLLLMNRMENMLGEARVNRDVV
jgi:hypothetical protein